ncbi:hypothetical protein PE067_17250 [Paracoccus sp. DMF-8]|uniref:hypothetical protein n=1 Tax=Paracoccus sp. DMF-8 TaxID=3019445 RepID=UPI0023E404FD|nr:hypothetical protein [Paracoccus sp. DMF-8]MDF3607732.1 hypothetical protein [Paracoccus sp. DMF-8]
MANRIIVTDVDMTDDNILFVTRRALPQTIAGLVAGTWYTLNTAMSGPITVAAAPPPPGQLRTPLTSASNHVHSGHSLTDDYAAWHRNMRELLVSIGVTAPYETMKNSLMPGSSIMARWEHEFDVASINTDARRNIVEFDTLMITESLPVPRFAHPDEDVDHQRRTLDYLCRFVANTIVNGGGNDVILWSIWPDIHGPGASATQPASPLWSEFAFRTGLPEHGRIFKYMADYTTWKMKQLYPSLPDNWRAWVFPGHLFMQHLYDDIIAGVAPGYTVVEDIFSDDIHAADPTSYGLTCLVTTLLYGFDLEALDAVNPGSVFIPEYATRAQAEYFWALANRIAAEYEPAGRGGTVGGEAALCGIGNQHREHNGGQVQPGRPCGRRNRGRPASRPRPVQGGHHP